VANILEMRSITKTFPGVKALQDVTLEVARGQIHAICGENGAGKSTLMKVLSGVYPHGTYDGDIVFDHRIGLMTQEDPVDTAPPHVQAHLGVGGGRGCAPAEAVPD